MKTKRAQLPISGEDIRVLWHQGNMQHSCPGFPVICHLVFLILLVISPTGLTELTAQLVHVDATIRQSTEGALQINGDLVLKRQPGLHGTVTLGGSLTDHAGLLMQEGLWRFNGDGQKQFLNGSKISVLHHLEIAPGARLALSPQARLTVNGTLENLNEEDGLILKNTIGEKSSLLHYEAGVIARVQFGLPESQNLQKTISSPVLEQIIEPEFHQGSDNLFAWYERQQVYVRYTDQTHYPTFADANAGADYFISARGYYVQYYPSSDHNFVRIFAGELHQGSQEYTLMVQSHPSDNAHGFNLMGNPYPSPIDWLAEEGWSGREYLVGGDKGDHVMWLWNESIQNYGASHTRSRLKSHNGNKGLIPSMDGFWVQAAQGNDGKKIGMDDRVRLHGEDDQIVYKEQIQSQAIRIILSSDSGPHHDEVIVELGHQRPGAARKKFPTRGKSPQLYIRHDKLSYSNLLGEETQGQAQTPWEEDSREARGISILLLDTMKAELHIPLEAITRKTGNYSIRLEYEKEFDADVFLVMKGPEGTLKVSASSLENTQGAPEDTDNILEGVASALKGQYSNLKSPEAYKRIEVGRLYQVHAAEEDLQWQFDLFIRP